eukprot:scaffold13482_cov79-Isochrysis_galbana.AAC.2
MSHGRQSGSRPCRAAARASADTSKPPRGMSGAASAAAARVSSPSAGACTSCHCGEKRRKPRNFASTHDRAACSDSAAHAAAAALAAAAADRFVLPVGWGLTPAVGWAVPSPAHAPTHEGRWPSPAIPCAQDAPVAVPGVRAG